MRSEPQTYTPKFLAVTPKYIENFDRSTLLSTPNVGIQKQGTYVIYERRNRSPGRIPNDSKINETDVIYGRRNRSPGRIPNDRKINEIDVIYRHRNRSLGRIPIYNNINETDVIQGRTRSPGKKSIDKRLFCKLPAL